MEKLQVTVPPPTVNVLPTGHEGIGAALSRRIEQAVRRDAGGRIHKLRVEVGRAKVVLRGFCSTFYAKQLAQHAAMPLAEGRALENQIQVW